MTTHDKLTLGPARYFVPICVRHPHGFYGGPAGYQEMSKSLAVKSAPIIIPWHERKDR